MSRPTPVLAVPATNFGGPDYLEVEDLLMRTRTKVAALQHLFSQYSGELEFTDEAAHGVAMLLEDIYDGLKSPDGATR